MKLIHTFTCELTGDTVGIYEMPDGTQVAESITLPQEDEAEIEALCIEYLLS